MTAEIRRMCASDAPAVAALADRAIGPGYYSVAEVLDYLRRSTAGGQAFSYVALRDDALLGFRFVLPPGAWQHGRGHGLSPEDWPGVQAKAAYFQSCFVAPEAMGQGLGGRMARLALADLRAQGAELVVTHSWKESPHDSSRRYLRRLGFTEVAEYPDYWRNIDYHCARCGRPCLCTAVEFVRALTDEAP
jgi:hypothetical protein